MESKLRPDRIYNPCGRTVSPLHPACPAGCPDSPRPWRCARVGGVCARSRSARGRPAGAHAARSPPGHVRPRVCRNVATHRESFPGGRGLRIRCGRARRGRKSVEEAEPARRAGGRSSQLFSLGVWGRSFCLGWDASAAGGAKKGRKEGARGGRGRGLGEERRAMRARVAAPRT